MDYPGFEKREEDRYNAVRYVLADRRGRQFLQMVMDECGVYSSSYHGDVHETLVHEGMRHVGLWVRTLVMEHNPNTYVHLVKENKEREEYYATLDEETAKEPWE